jgi:hypothetical protein
VANRYTKPSLNALWRRRLPRNNGLMSNKVVANVTEGNLDDKGRVESVTLSVHGPSRTARGTKLGLGSSPSFVIARRIECALDPVRAPGKVRTLKDMTQEERARIATELGVESPMTPAEKPRSLCVKHLCLGPEYSCTVENKRGGSITWRKSDLFLTSNRYWKELQAVQARFHLYRSDKFDYTYNVTSEQREAILALGVRAVNRIEERILKLGR